MEQLIQNPADVRRLWDRARPYVAMSDADITGLSESVVRGMTVEELERPRPGQDAPKEPTPPTDEEIADDDRRNGAEPFDGLR